MANTVRCSMDCEDVDDEFNNVEICVCESGNASNIPNSQFSIIQSLLPETYHHLICEFSTMKSNAEASVLEQENNYETFVEPSSQNLASASTDTEGSSDRPVISSGYQDFATNDIRVSDESRCEAISQIGSDLSNGMCNAFRAKLRVNVNSFSELERWRMQFAERSKTTMRFANTSVCTGRKTLFKARLRCQHNTKPRSMTADTRKSSKNTRCPAFISLTLKRSEFFTSREDSSQHGVKRCQSLDVHLPEYPLAVVIQFNHNHMLDSTSVLRRRDVSPEIEAKFTALMHVGHNPVAALSLHKYDLYLLHGLKNYSTYVSDRHHCPDLAWCYRIFYKLFKKKFRESITSLNIEKLTECVERCRHQLSSSTSSSPPVLVLPSENSHVSTQMNNDQNSQILSSIDLGEDFIAVDVTEEREIAVAICTPLMKRVHRLVQQSAEIVFVDTSPLLGKRRRCRTVIMMTNSCAGGLPLGVLVASSDSAIKRATQLFTGLLDSRCFFGRGPQLGPILFVVSDCSAVQEAFSTEFCSSSVLLSSHHILIGFWRLLWDRKSTVIVGHRTGVFELLRSAMLATSMELFLARFVDLCSDSSVASSPMSLAYIKNIQRRVNEWSVLCQAPDWIPVSVVDSLGGIQGLCSCVSRSLKDAVIHRLKSMETIVTVLDFVGTRIDTYFDHRLTDLVNERADNATALRFMPDDADSDDIVERNSCYNFTVSSPSIAFLNSQRDTNSNQDTAESIKQVDSTFHVEMFIGLCSCEIGSTGAPCRHQWSVLRHVSLCSWQLVQIDCSAAKRLLTHVGSGQGNAEPSWFAVSHPLQSILPVTLFEGEGENDDKVNCISTDAAEAVITAVQSDTPSSGYEMLNKEVLLTWNGTSYELNVPPDESPGFAVVLPVPVMGPPPASLERLRGALKKIEDAYVVHSVAMESAVSAFCQSVDDIDTVELLNGALLGFTNSCSYLTSGSNGATTHNWA